MGFLSSEFVNKYKNIEPRNAGVLFYPVYLRTYSRWLPEKRRRERWYETVQRVVEFNMSLYSGSRKDLIEEAEEIFDKIFHLEVLPAGRTLWVGGTGVKGESSFNCSHSTIEDIDIFGDIFQLLLSGCGVGFRVLKEDVDNLPLFCRKVNTFHEKYNTIYPFTKQAETIFRPSIDTGAVEDGHMGVYITIGDSREGWVEALRLFLKYSLFSEDISTVSFDFNYDCIRPKGSRIHTFGGRAPGPEGLMEMFDNIAKVINSAPLTVDGGRKLTPVNCMDICNHIAKNVIVGGTRRSSQIALGSPDDLEFLDAKKDLWINKDNLQRTMSNNSVVFEDDPTFEQIQNIFNGIRNNGEPGFFNLKSARKRREEVYGINPCAEILLNKFGFCNLSTVNLKAFVTKTNTFDLFGAMRAMRLATRIGLRTTNITVSLPRWDETQKKERLLGVSLTGIMDMLNAINIDIESDKAAIIFNALRNAANNEADLYAKELGVPRPLLVTCIKPEGTLSQLPTVSSGLHDAYAPYYIRRIRVSNMDPVCLALQKLGVPNELDVGKAERVVFSFPIKTEATQAAANIPALKQFQRYLTFMETYVDHNASCTLTIGDGEWEEMEKAVYDNFDKVIACAFLPKYTDAFPQMPYEEISREQYEEMIRNFPSLDGLSELVDEIENHQEFETELFELECSGNQCPIR